MVRTWPFFLTRLQPQVGVPASSVSLSFQMWTRRKGCLLFAGHFLQKSPIISGIHEIRTAYRIWSVVSFHSKCDRLNSRSLLQKSPIKETTLKLKASTMYAQPIAFGVPFQSPIWISSDDISFQRNVAKKKNPRPRSSIEIWDWRIDTPHAIGCWFIVNAVSCRSLSVKEPLIIGLFSRKWHVKIRHPVRLGHVVRESSVCGVCICTQKECLITGLFCGNWPIKIRHPVRPGHVVRAPSVCGVCMCTQKDANGGLFAERDLQLDLLRKETCNVGGLPHRVGAYI